jgi:hypothetical protein
MIHAAKHGIGRGSIVIVSLALLLGGCSSESPPEAITHTLGATSTRVTGRTATASFGMVGECGLSHLRIDVDESSYQQPGSRPQASSWASVSVFEVDTCNGGWDVIVSGHGFVDLRNGEFTMSGDLGAARLRTTVDVQDWRSGAVVPVAVDLTWTGVGEASVGKDRSNADQDGVKHRYRGDSIARDAHTSGAIDLSFFGIDVPMPGVGSLHQHRYAHTTIETKRPIAPTIEYFYAYPSEVYPEGIVTLAWWVRGSEPMSVSIDGGVGDVTGLGYVAVVAHETTTYTLTASNVRGSDSARFTVTVLPSPEPDAYEDNDHVARATPIGVDEYGNLHFFDYALTITPGDVDWFVFTIEGPAVVSANVWPHDWDLVTIVGLFDDTVTPVEGYESWRETQLEAGTYYLAVTGNPDGDFTGDHTRSGSYTLHVASLRMPPDDELEPNDGPWEATPIELDHASGPLTITPRDVDWFTFEVDAPVRLVASITYSNTLYPLIALYDASVDHVAGYSSWLEADLEPGRYFVAMSAEPDYALQGDHDAFGFYSFTLTAQALE